MILFSCAHATERMTDHLEGALPWPKKLAMRGHLLMCRACRAFLRSLGALPRLAREAFEEPLPESAVGCASLDAALGRIRSGEGRGPRFHPEAPHWDLLREGSLDLPLRLLMETHLGACAECRAAHPMAAAHAPVEASPGVPPVPGGVLSQLPDPKTWTWYRRLLGGARSARLWEDAATGAGLWLTFVPSGCRFPDHRHTGDEAAVLLTGWVEDGPELNGPGDFVRHGSGTHHAPVATGTDGCWILARVGPGGLRFSGWRRIFG
ncbi:MAG TPA: zf-HC2 domain-containing protein [Holophagaceae bacterium]|nr:zf-HC2 domain-containing protein [Holophagaceae bacterium]